MNTLPLEFACDAALFDLDGVLVDSHVVVERHWRRWAEQHGLDGDALLRVIHGRRPVEIIRAAAPHLPAEEEAVRVATAEAFDTDGVTAIDGAAQLLRTLPEGCWAIVTSGTHDAASTRLAHTGLSAPPVFITADDVAHGKPHPEPYLRAAEALGIAPERCVVVEDTPAGLDAAHAAGMRVVAVTTTHTRAALARADAIAGRLLDIDIRPADRAADARLMLRVR